METKSVKKEENFILLKCPLCSNKKGKCKKNCSLKKNSNLKYKIMIYFFMFLSFLESLWLMFQFFGNDILELPVFDNLKKIKMNNKFILVFSVLPLFLLLFLHFLGILPFLIEVVVDFFLLCLSAGLVEYYKTTILTIKKINNWYLKWDAIKIYLNQFPNYKIIKNYTDMTSDVSVNIAYYIKSLISKKK